ncbi:AsmA family protein [Ferrovibrio terrae]|uniref:AsmA family protein n=1 Tax=Ferrovibrio terrae TaxID=2594003 RepID=A0A516H5G0_9PROT|nr:AsmA family protein [Ferrovibrio terrae]QDO98910.1 AsmA family protein [Ferrovibrio terrae]
MRILKWIVAVVVLLVAGAVIAVLTVDVNRFKPQIVAAVENATGRKLDIAQDMKLSLWPLGIGVKQVSFANAAWGGRPQMATVGEFTAQVDLMALIGGQVKVDSLVLNDVDLLLEKDRQGRGNWDFTGQKPAPQQQPQSQATTQSGGTIIPSIENVALKNVRLTYRDAQANSQNNVVLSELTVKQAKGGLLAVKMVADVDGKAITADGTLGSFDDLMSGSRPWPVKMAATLPGAKVSVDGSIAQPMQAKGIALKLTVDAPDLSKVAALAGASAPAVPLTLQADVKDTGPQRYALSNIAAKVADSDLSGNGEVNLAGAKPAVRFDLASKNMDVTQLMPKDSAKPATGGSTAAGGSAGSSAGGQKRLFSSDPLPLEGLNAVDATGSYKAERLKAPKLDAQGVALNLTLKDGVLNAKPAIANLSNGSLNGDITVNAKSKSMTAKLDGKGVVLSEYLQKAGITDIVRRGGPADLVLDVTSSAASMQQMMAGLNGKMVLKVGEGELKEEYIRDFLPGLARAVSALDRATAKTKLHCVVSGLDFKNGVVTPKAILAETGSMTMTGDGTINLGTERIDLKLVPSSRDTGLAAMLPPVNVRGSLADPSFTPDSAALAKGVLGAVAGVAALGPLALLSPAMGSGGDDAATACAKAVALAEGRPVPQSAKPATGSPATGTQTQDQQKPESRGDALRRGLGNLLGR